MMNNSASYTQEKRALVIGGGIAGLLVARVLSDYYADVVVIERDERPEQPGPRAGSPQSFHLHQVLPRGEMILESFFPGFGADLLAQGAFQMRDTGAVMINRYGTVPFPGGDGKAVTYSRALLEWVLRQRVQALPNVRFLYHQEVTSLEVSADYTRVTGLHIRERGQLERQVTLTADLVVVANGRSSKLPQWLSALGYELAEDERLSTKIGYTTRTYKVPAHKKNDLSVVVIEGNPATGNAIGGVLKRIEGDAWMVCLASVGGQYPPVDARGFDEGFSHLINPALADILRGAEPLTEPRGFRLPECVRHHYERMEQWPAGLLVLGDAFCYFDPVYGQGMTLAAIEAETIATCFREAQGQPQPGFERHVLQQMQEAIYPAWWRSAIEDLLWPGVTHSGPEPLKGVPLLHKYFELCLKKSTQKLESSQQKGEFNPLFFKYFMMNWLFISPREVINADMLDTLLEDETPSEKQAILAELFQGYEHRPIDEVLDEVVPNFSFTFNMQSMLPPDVEAQESHSN